jgi:hypothetical protein
MPFCPFIEGNEADLQKRLAGIDQGDDDLPFHLCVILQMDRVGWRERNAELDGLGECRSCPKKEAKQEAGFQ